MSFEWFKSLSPIRRFTIKAITRAAAASVPFVGDQLNAIFETAFDELEKFEESRDLIELTALVNHRFDALISEVELTVQSTKQVESVVSQFIERNREALQADLQAIDQRVVMVQTSLSRLHDGLTRVEAKVDDVGLQVQSILANMSQAENQASQRAHQAQLERAQHNQKLDHLIGEIDSLKRQILVQSRGSLGDTLSLRSEQEKRLIREILHRYRELPLQEREQFQVANDLSVLLTTANMHTEADELLGVTTAAADTKEERGLALFNRYMNALKANHLKAALEFYVAAVREDAGVALFPPEKFTPYQILGYGAFGVTFLCDQFGSKVALKSISLNRALGESEEVVHRLAREWTTLVSLSDPRIIRARDFDTYRQKNNGEYRPYLTMEYFDGDNLQDYCEKNKKVFGVHNLDHTLRVAVEIARGLKVAHQSGVIHRDIKPANIMYCGDESGFEIRIIDFGLALPPRNMSEHSILVSQGSLSHNQGSLLAHTIAGTIKYAPPEQMGEGGEVGTHSDVYSWGRTLNFLLFGRTDPRTRDIRRLNDDLQDLIDDALENSPTKRLRNFDTVIDILERQLSQAENGQSDVKSQSSSTLLHKNIFPIFSSDQTPLSHDAPIHQDSSFLQKLFTESIATPQVEESSHQFEKLPPPFTPYVEDHQVVFDQSLVDEWIEREVDRAYDIIVFGRSNERYQRISVSGKVVIGRAQYSDVNLDSDNISRRHCQIEARANQFIVTDLESTNGTYINNEKLVGSTEVSEFDLITIGDFTLRLEFDSSTSLYRSK